MADTIVKQPPARARMLAVWSVLASVFKTDEPLPAQPALAIAMVARKRWSEHVVLPSATNYRRMRGINWNRAGASTPEGRKLLMIREVEKVWH